MTSSDAVADTERQKLESTRTPSVIGDACRYIQLTEDDLRWMLRWHGDFVRHVTLLEVALKERDRRTRQTRRRKKTRR
jgi:hypothetical protein